MKKRILLGIVIAVIVVGGVSAGYLVWKKRHDKKEPTPTATNTPAQIINDFAGDAKKAADEEKDPQTKLAKRVEYANYLLAVNKSQEALTELKNIEKSFSVTQLQKSGFYGVMWNAYVATGDKQQAEIYKQKYIAVLKLNGQEAMAKQIENPTPGMQQ